jgi:hypothetical protein
MHALGKMFPIVLVAAAAALVAVLLLEDEVHDDETGESPPDAAGPEAPTDGPEPAPAGV